MSKFFLFSRFNTNKHARPQAKWYRSLRLNYFGLNIIFISLVIVLFISYIFLVNNTASAGFAYHNLETQLNEAQEKNEKLELQVHSLQSMDHVASLKENYSFEPVQKDVQYLTTQPAAVALSE